MNQLYLECGKGHQWRVPDSPDVRGPVCPVCKGLPRSGPVRNLFDDVRKFFGLLPHDKLNPCYLDGYFAADCRAVWGEAYWTGALKLIGGDR